MSLVEGLLEESVKASPIIDEVIMKLRTIGLISSLALGLSAAPLPAEAQQTGKMPKVGFLSAFSSAARRDRVQAFRQGLRDLGYVEGQNVIVEYRYAEGGLERMAKLAAELIRLKVDIIVSGGGSALARIIKRATNVIPIVMTSGSNPVGAGLIASFSHPGGNVTGLTSLTKDLSGKRLELLKEAVPKASRVGVLYDPTILVLHLCLLKYIKVHR